jgi:hypothetical protein
MGDMNIRNVDDALIWAVKQRAVQERQTLREWVIDVLGRAVGTMPVGGSGEEGEEQPLEHNTPPAPLEEDELSSGIEPKLDSSDETLAKVRATYEQNAARTREMRETDESAGKTRDEIVEDAQKRLEELRKKQASGGFQQAFGDVEYGKFKPRKP